MAPKDELEVVVVIRSYPARGKDSEGPLCGTLGSHCSGGEADE